MKSKYFIRNFEADKYIEIFLVSAVFAVLAIRLFLRLTDYPQIGSDQLHIAHILWGGLLMLASIISLLFFLSKRAMIWSSLLGGLGFGTFIDEIGKFVTKDNNYFYEPAVSLIYITFVLILIAVNTIETRWRRTSEEYLINAVNELKGIPIDDLDEYERKRALSYLKKSGYDSDFAVTLRNIIENTVAIPLPRPGFYTRLKRFMIEKYEWITSFKFFNIGLIVFFTLQFLATLTYIVALTFLFGIGWEKLKGINAVREVNGQLMTLSFIELAELFSSIVSGLLIVAGVYLLRKSRLRAYDMFKRSVLVSIFLTHVFIFYKEQFSAMTGLIFNILVLIALEFMIEREKERRMKENRKLHEFHN